MRTCSLVPVVSLVLALVVGCASAPSIYKSVDREAAILNAYHERLERWPVPYESRFISTSWGVAHVVGSGPRDAPPVVLLHAMGVGSTMWRANVGALASDRRVYCLDFIGDLGLSRLADLERHPRDGAEVAAFLVEVLDGLGVERADLVGASFGGWAALQLAARAPERVARVALLGPMGVAPATSETIARVTALVVHPTDEKKRDMVEWTLGDAPAVRGELEPYMLIAMDCHGRLPPPSTFSDEELRRVRAPVLLLLGERDGPVGPPAPALERMRALVDDIDAVVLSDTGHMMSLERADDVNQRLRAFLEPTHEREGRDS